MNVEIKVIKGLPTEQINKFEDRVVYNTAVITREYTKSRNVYPYRTGKLMRSEVASPVLGSNKKYSLTGGVDYAKYVWSMTNVKWTNPETKPQWYYSSFNEKGAVLVSNAVIRAMKEI